MMKRKSLWYIGFNCWMLKKSWECHQRHKAALRIKRTIWKYASPFQKENNNIDTFNLLCSPSSIEGFYFGSPIRMQFETFLTWLWWCLCGCWTRWIAVRYKSIKVRIWSLFIYCLIEERYKTHVYIYTDNCILYLSFTWYWNIKWRISDWRTSNILLESSSFHRVNRETVPDV